jgi:hypothetical protein
MRRCAIWILPPTAAELSVAASCGLLFWLLAVRFQTRGTRAK